MVEGYVQVTTTTDSQEEARRLGRTAVEARLAACGQVFGPISSTYWWKGAIETAEEWVCLMKTTMEQADPLIAHIKQEHSYETPDITAIPISNGSADYLAWIRKETSS